MKAAIFAALLLMTTAVMAGFDGGNAPGGQQVKGKWYNPEQGGQSTCCADVEAIKLGMGSKRQDLNDAAEDALLQKLLKMQDQ